MCFFFFLTFPELIPEYYLRTIHPPTDYIRPFHVSSKLINKCHTILRLELEIDIFEFQKEIRANFHAERQD